MVKNITKAQLVDKVCRLEQRIEKLQAVVSRHEQAEAAWQESEKRYRLLIENASESIVVAQDGLFTFCNPRVFEVTGYSEEDLMGRPFLEIIHPDDQAMVIKRYSRRLAGELPPPVYPFRIIDKEGTTRWVEVNAVRITWNGRPATLNYLNDITERVQALQALRESEELHRTVIRTSPDAITVTDLNGRITGLSQRALELHGIKDAEELLGRSAFDLIAPCDRVQAAENLRKTLEEGSINGVTYTMLRKDGSSFTGELNASLIRDAQGNPKAFVAIVRDVSQQLRAEQELRRREEMLAALHETALELASQQSLPDLLQSIVASAVHLVGAEGGGIYLYRPKSDDLEYVLSYHLKPDTTGDVLLRGEGLSGKVLQSGQSIAVDEYSTWEGRAMRYDRRVSGPCVGVPIRWGGRLLGILNVLDNAPRRFSPEDIAVLEHFTPLAGAALEQTRLLEETRERWREAETLRQAGAAVTEVLSQDERLERILEQLARVVPYDSASVQLLEEGYLQIVGGRGFPDPDAVIGLRFPVPGDNPNTWVMQRKEPIILSDARAMHPPFREPPHDHICSWLGVPMIVQDRVIGLLALDSVDLGHFDLNHVRLILPFADQVAVALENARLYHDLQQQMEQLQTTQSQLIQSAKLAAVGQLAAGVAHELNNPLAIIQGFAELVLEGIGTDAPFRKDVERIIAESRRVHEIVRSLLDFARQSRPERRPSDLNEVLRATVDLTRYQLKQHGVAIEEDYAADIDPVLLDSGQMRQVFLNLTTNALHAMPEGGILSVRTARTGEGVAVSITDTGEGIPPEIQDRIFDPFFTTKRAGTGLGLSVSLGIVQEHGGTLTVESHMGMGSTFTVWLPAEQSPE